MSVERDWLGGTDAAQPRNPGGHGFATRACNCAVCGRFKRRPADRCDHCGDQPAQYGATAAEQREQERIHNRAYGYAA